MPHVLNNNDVAPTEETIVTIKTLVKPFVGALIALIKSIQDKDSGKKKRKKAEADVEEAITTLFALCPDIHQVEAAIAKAGTATLIAKDVLPSRRTRSKVHTAKKPVVKKPAAKKPAVKKPATEKPVAKKRGVIKSA